MTEEKPPHSATVLDIKTRKVIERVENVPDDDVQKFMRRWTRTCKDARVKSVFILVIDETDFCDWGFLPNNEHHQALACLTLEDLRQEIKDEIFGYEDLETED